MNILITCAGRRNYIVEYFKQALAGDGIVCVANSSTDASTMQVADRGFVAPLLYEPGYVDFLLDICARHDIQLLFSLFDMELPVLASSRQRFEDAGVRMAVSGPEVIAVCNDKLATAQFARKITCEPLFTTVSREQALGAVTRGEVNFPLYVKPRWGMGSLSMYRAETERELNVFYEKVERDIANSYLRHYQDLEAGASVIIQEAAPGDEYGMDVINDLDGNYVTTFVKKKVEMRAGETDVSVTVDVPVLRELGERMGKNLGHLGNLDVDIFWDGARARLLEMNARFGGGYPFSHQAGANIPRAYLCWARNQQPDPVDTSVSPGVKSLKGISIHKCGS